MCCHASQERELQLAKARDAKREKRRSVDSSASVTDAVTPEADSSSSSTAISSTVLSDDPVVVADPHVVLAASSSDAT